MEIIILLSAALTVFVFWMRHELDCLETTCYTVESERLPENFHEVRFVLLSDLHNKCFGLHHERLLSAIERATPDFLVVAGDLVTAGEKNGDMAGKQLMEKLGKKYDVFYGRGNHEEKLAAEDGGSYEQYVENTGVHFLNNESVLLERGGQKIRITGLSLPIEYFKKFRQTFLQQETVEELLGRKQDELFTLLIAHKPAHFPEYALWGADLVVSGHVHGGIMQLPVLGGIVSPQLEIFPKFDAGKFHIGKSTMVISRGLGSHSIPIRIHNRPELVVVMLKKKEINTNQKENRQE